MDLLLKKYIWVGYLVLIAMMSYFCARITGTFVGEALAVDSSKNLRISQKNQSINLANKSTLSMQDYNIISERNIFDSREQQINATPSASSDPSQFDPNAPAVKTNLAIKLISTFAIGDGTDSRSSATISGGGNKPEVYKVGSENAFNTSAKIVKILSNRVEFINNGRMEYVEIEDVTANNGNNSLGNGDIANPSGINPAKNLFPRGGDTKGTATKMTVDQRELDNALSKPDVLFTQINIGPYMDASGKPSGIRINRLSAQSLFSKLGLQAGDVLRRLNNEEMDMGKGMLIFSQLKDQKQFTLDIERRGQKITLEYDVK